MKIDHVWTPNQAQVRQHRKCSFRNTMGKGGGLCAAKPLPHQLSFGRVLVVLRVVGHVGARRRLLRVARRPRVLPEGGALGRAAENLDRVRHAVVDRDL